MADTDISPVVARLVTLIGAVTAVGNVYSYSPYDHDDTRSLLVATIDNVDVVRCWWVTGPTMTARKVVSAVEIERTWQYQIHGIVGVTEDGTDIPLLRTLALAVTDAIDAEHDLNATCHRTDPCIWRIQPEYRTMLAGVGLAYTQIIKPVVTLSTPT